MNIVKLIQKIPHHHPYDWIEHFLLLFFIAGIGMQFIQPYTVIWICISIILTIEGTQIEAGIWQKWDHVIDIVFGAVGAWAGTVIGLIIYLGK